jgi:hypothetical protein
MGAGLPGGGPLQGTYALCSLGMDTVFAGLAVLVAAAAAVVAWRQQGRNTRTQEAIAELQRRQVEVQDRLGAIELERWRDEQRPRLVMKFERSRRDGSRSPHVIITNEGPLDYEEVLVELRDMPPLVVGFSPNRSTTTQLGPLALGATSIADLEEDVKARGGELKAWATCSAGGQSWRVLLTCEVPSYARLSRAR